MSPKHIFIRQLNYKKSSRNGETLLKEAKHTCLKCVKKLQYIIRTIFFWGGEFQPYSDFHNMRFSHCMQHALLCLGIIQHAAMRMSSH